MGGNIFRFKQFSIQQADTSFKVGTDGVLLGAWADMNDVTNALDVGTGTGLIALMLAQRSSALITAIEPDEGSFRQACENVKNSGWQDRICVERTDLHSFAEKCQDKFDLIVTNPPFFSKSLINPDSREARARHTITLTHETIFRSAAVLLNDSGRLCMVLPYAEGMVAVAEAANHGLYCYEMIKVKPTPESEVKRLLLAFRKSREELKSRFLVIESGGRHIYSKEYSDLTHDFYLDR